MELPKEKRRSYLLSALYKTLFGKFSRNVLATGKLKLLLYLTWVFERLSYNASYYYYPTWDHPGRKNTWESLAKHLDPEFTVLDMGCSNGHYSNLIATKARKVVGVDHDPAAIAYARRTYPRGNLEFHNSDALEYLRNNDHRFDLLVLTHVLEHLEDPAEFLLTFKTFFNYVYIEVPDFDSGQLNQFRRHVGSNYLYTDEDHKWEFSRQELLELADRCALTVLDEKHIWGVQTIFAKC